MKTGGGPRQSLKYKIKIYVSDINVNKMKISLEMGF